MNLTSYALSYLTGSHVGIILIIMLSQSLMHSFSKYWCGTFSFIGRYFDGDMGLLIPWVSGYPLRWNRKKQERGEGTVLNYRFEHSRQEEVTGSDSGRGKGLGGHVSIQPERTVCPRLKAASVLGTPWEASATGGGAGVGEGRWGPSGKWGGGLCQVGVLHRHSGSQ